MRKTSAGSSDSAGYRRTYFNGLGNAVIWCLIKFFEEERFADEFIAGRLYMNTLKYFKELEDQICDGRADPSEAVWAWLQTGGVKITITPNGFDPINITESDLAAPISMSYTRHEYLNVLCLYAIHSGVFNESARELEEKNECTIDLNIECTNLGEFAVIVSAGPFIDGVRAALGKNGYKAEGKLVTYYDDKTFSGEIPLNEDPYWKQKRFENQREFRICVCCPNADGLPLRIEIGSLSSCSAKLRSSELPPQLFFKRTLAEGS